MAAIDCYGPEAEQRGMKVVQNRVIDTVITMSIFLYSYMTLGAEAACARKASAAVQGYVDVDMHLDAGNRPGDRRPSGQGPGRVRSPRRFPRSGGEPGGGAARGCKAAARLTGH